MNEFLKALKEKFYLVQYFEFKASTQLGKNGWEGVGNGNVRIEKIDENTIIFYENGKFLSNIQNAQNEKPTKEIKCSNVYRWIFEEESIKLEHLRFGTENPVYLFDLIHFQDNKMISKCGHVCDKDLYNAELFLFDDKILLHWRIFGEEKNEIIEYVYT